MIKFTLKEPLSFLRNKTDKGGEILSGHVEFHKGVYRITSGKFVQNISAKKYALLMKAAKTSEATVEQAAPEVDAPAIVDAPAAPGKGKNGQGTRRK